jgi:hypothetical protein
MKNTYSYLFGFKCDFSAWQRSHHPAYIINSINFILNIPTSKHHKAI